MKILEIFWGKSTGIYRKMQDHRDLLSEFDCTGKMKQWSCKTLRIWSKNVENYENFQENFQSFSLLSLWKIDFLTMILLNISWISDSAPKI